MNNSILTSIKKLLGITEDNKDFDLDIIIHINTTFMILNQLGIGPLEGFRIKDERTKWSEFISEDDKLDDVITYVYLNVKRVFDPPLSSTVIEANKQMIDELEWRLNVEAESK